MSEQKRLSQLPRESEVDLIPLAVTAIAINPSSEGLQTNNNIIQSSLPLGSKGKRIALQKSAKRFSQQFQSAILSDLQLNGSALVSGVNEVVPIAKVRENIERFSFVPTETSFLIENSKREPSSNINSRFADQQNGHIHSLKGRRLTDIRALSKARSLSAPSNNFNNDNSELALNVVSRSSIRTEDYQQASDRNNGHTLHTVRPSHEIRSNQFSNIQETDGSLDTLLAVRNIRH